MHIVATNDFPQAVEPAFVLLRDPEFLDAVCRATHPLEYSVTVDGLTTGSRRVLENHPSIRRFTGPTITVTDEIEWDADPSDGVRRGRTRVAVEGMPVELLGTVALEGRGTGSRLTYSGELTVAIPLLGPSLERQAKPLLVEALSRQEQVAQARQA
jgi:hypothetical protein